MQKKLTHTVCNVKYNIIFVDVPHLNFLLLQKLHSQYNTNFY